MNQQINNPDSNKMNTGNQVIDINSCSHLDNNGSKSDLASLTFNSSIKPEDNKDDKENNDHMNLS